jgi:hypothetical protein
MLEIMSSSKLLFSGMLCGVVASLSGESVRFKVIINPEHPPFFDVTPYRPSNFNQLFGETYRLHLQNSRISQARK